MHILDLIDSYAETKKDIIAYHNRKSDGRMESITYGELAVLSDRLAGYLSRTLGEDRTPLIVYGHKSIYMLICFLACVKSGHAYCPVDISVPLERVRDIAVQTASPVILATEKLDIEAECILDLDAIKAVLQCREKPADPALRVKGEDVYYIIFTSGSTGKPKGVQITESCLCHFIEWVCTLGEGRMKDKQLTFINQAPFSFDLSVMDLYLSLYLGGTLWTLDKTTQTDMKALFNSLRESNADVWVSTPSFADMCLADKSFRQELMPRMGLFLFCGETLTNKTAQKLHQCFPNAVVVNTYGPTESTVAVTQVVVTPALCSQVSPLPVGAVKEGTKLVILDESGRALPEGEKGEIVIIGNTVSPGYFGREDLTKKAFFPYQDAGETLRAYRTGDEGYLKDGQLFYCGRIDLQIKLHGYRIEIEDIENNILKLSGVENAVVLPVVKDGVIKSLTAFVVPAFAVGDRFESAQKLRRELAAFLPAYMVPKKFVFLDAIPMTNNGKADRKALGGLLR